MKGHDMNKTIERLNAQLAKVSSNAADIEIQLQTAWDKVFNKNKALKKAIQEVESSNEYAWNKYGEIVSWIRFDHADFDKCREYLKTWLRENHYVEVDFANDALMYAVGTSIVINDDGDVYDQDGDKFFIKKNDYRDENGELDIEKRNELIEAYMEKTGCYPGVFSSDRHGNVFSISTVAKKKAG